MRFYFLLVLIILCSSCTSILNCPETPPEFSVYPDSELIEENMSRVPYVLLFEYSTDASWLQVKNFYESTMECRNPTNNNAIFVCEGDANPYGSYTVNINSQDIVADDFRYSITLSWNQNSGCY